MLIIHFLICRIFILIGSLLHINSNTLIPNPTYLPHRTIGKGCSLATECTIAHVCALGNKTSILRLATCRDILRRVWIYNMVYLGPLFLGSHSHSFGKSFLLLKFGRRNQ